MDKYTLQEEAYKRGYEAGLRDAGKKAEGSWVGKTVICREITVNIVRDSGDYLYGFDMEDHWYKINKSGLYVLENPAEGIVR